MGNQVETPVGVSPPFGQMADALGLGMAFQLQTSADFQKRVFTYLGEHCRDIAGVDAAAALADPWRLFGLFDSQDRAKFLDLERSAAADLNRYEMEVRVTPPGKGEVRWLRATASPRRQADGSILWDGLLADITEAKRRTVELAEQRWRAATAIEATGMGLWALEVSSRTLRWSDRNRELFGVAPGEEITVARYAERVHPEDRARVAAAYREICEQPEGADFLIEHRLAPEQGGRERWVQSRGRVASDEAGVRQILGATLDISDRMASEERRALLLGELAHRSKNGLQVLMAIVSQTARHTDSVKVFEKTLMARLRAMADSQELITAAAGRPVALNDVLTRSLTPFDLGRFDVPDMADVTVAGEIAVPLALLLHELATNAVKYGALSAPHGRVTIRKVSDVEAAAALTWVESGGPLTGPPRRKGFGSRLMDVSLRNQGGRVHALFEASGFQARIDFPSGGAMHPPPELLTIDSLTPPEAGSKTT